MNDDRQVLDTPLFRAAAGFGLAALSLEALGRLREEDLRGQVVVITGGSRGLGLAMARAFAREGCRIVIAARDVEELERALTDLEGRGAEVLAVRCDIADRQQAENLVAIAEDHFGAVDILVNNAGVIAVGPIELMTPEDFEVMLGVMFWGAVYPTWAALPRMRERGRGRIVNITSVGGKVPIPHLLPYCAAKHAAVGLSEGLRAELMAEGIRVTTVVPGLMRTGAHLNAFVKGRQEVEFSVFSAIETVPLFSISVESAARRIVQATKRGEAEVTLSLPAKLMARFHGLFPGAMTDLMGLFSRALPSAEGGSAIAERGMDVRERVEAPRAADPLGLGEAAAEAHNQYPGPVHALDGEGASDVVVEAADAPT